MRIPVKRLQPGNFGCTAVFETAVGLRIRLFSRERVWPWDIPLREAEPPEPRLLPSYSGLQAVHPPPRRRGSMRLAYSRTDTPVGWLCAHYPVRGLSPSASSPQEQPNHQEARPHVFNNAGSSLCSRITIRNPGSHTGTLLDWESAKRDSGCDEFADHNHLPNLDCAPGAMLDC